APATCAPGPDQLVGAPGFSVKKVGVAESERVVELPVFCVCFEKAVQVDTYRIEQLAGRLVVALGRFDIERSAVQDEGPAVVLEFVAVGMSAEIVVIIQDKHSRIPPDILDEVMRGGQAA